jgi:hypothetical protein
LEKKRKADVGRGLPRSGKATGPLRQIRIFAGADFRLNTKFSGNRWDSFAQLSQMLAARWGKSGECAM